MCYMKCLNPGNIGGTYGTSQHCLCVYVCVNHNRKHSEAGGQGTHAARAMSSVHVSVPLCLYTSGTAGERVALGPTSHRHYLDCEGRDGEVLLWLKSQPKWTNLFVPYRPVQSQTKPSLRFVVSMTHSMCVCVL